MARFPVPRSASLLAALLITGALAQPAPAMEVSINEVQSRVRTNDSGGVSAGVLGGIVKTVVKALEEEDQRKRRQEQQRPL